MDISLGSALKSCSSALDPGFTQIPTSESSGSRLEGGNGGRFSSGGAWARPVLAPEERRWSSDVFPYGDL
jgi:hypothetical protein